MNYSMQSFSNYPRLILLAFSLFFIGCSADDEGTISGQYTDGVFIVNEGNFSEADGSLSFYNKATKEVSLKIFESVNGTPLSGTFQSLTFHNNRGYLIDNTGSVEVFEENTLQTVATVTSPLFVQPRYMAAVGDKAYISDWGPYDDNWANTESFLAVLDLKSLEIVKTIPVDSRPQEMLSYKNKIYIANEGSNVITVLNPADDNMEKIEVPDTPQAMVLDASGNIWVLTGSSKIVSIDPDSKTIEKIISLEGDSPAGELEIDPSRGILYFLTSRYEPDYTTVNNVYAFNINEGTVGADPLLSKKNLYGLGVDPKTGIIYVADNNALQGNGTVIRFDPDGTEIDHFAVGRNPSGFVFK